MSEGTFNEETFEYDAPGERTKGTFTCITEAGEEVEIKDKYGAGNGITVLRSVEGADYVDAGDGTITRYYPELHDGGVPATGEAGALTGDSADATDAAEVRQALDESLMQDGVDATEAAEAAAVVEAELAPSPTALPESPPAAPEVPPAEEPAAEEQPLPIDEKPPPAEEPAAEE